jgi:hypothetical protein
LAVVAAAALVAFAMVRGGGDSGPASDDTATVGRATTTVARPSTTVVPPTTVAVTPPRAEADEVVPAVPADDDEPRPGLVITNSGSATVSVGGNVVSGASPGTVVTGSATAVGNNSTVRTP